QGGDDSRLLTAGRHWQPAGFSAAVGIASLIFISTGHECRVPQAVSLTAAGNCLTEHVQSRNCFMVPLKDIWR
ncbi:unnamed protein product, partial [Fusarium graminearum]